MISANLLFVSYECFMLTFAIYISGCISVTRREVLIPINQMLILVPKIPFNICQLLKGYDMMIFGHYCNSELLT